MPTVMFKKMQGAGNDFVVIDNREYGFTLEEIIDFTPAMCDRRFGIGADGVLILEKPRMEKVDYTMIYRNADGSDAGMCGNGSRCLALFAAESGYPENQRFNVHESVYRAKVDPVTGHVVISFPDVQLPEHISVKDQKLVQLYPGTEHVVKFVAEDVLQDEDELIKTGRSLRMDESLNPPGTNVNFVCPSSTNMVQLQTYERGVENLTLACGTGALASAIATHFSGEQDHSDWIVKVKGGTLGVSFQFDPEAQLYTKLKLSGPAKVVFEGTFHV